MDGLKTDGTSRKYIEADYKILRLRGCSTERPRNSNVTLSGGVLHWSTNPTGTHGDEG